MDVLPGHEPRARLGDSQLAHHRQLHLMNVNILGCV
jgi:hypothetical protein